MPEQTKESNERLTLLSPNQRLREAAKKIARELNVSRGTFQSRPHVIFKKVDVQSRNWSFGSAKVLPTSPEANN
jgi:hypothetical protein